jgi:transposase-like protein
MVAAVRQHQSIRAVAHRFGVSTSTVVYWVERAKGQRLDRVDWEDRSRAPHHTQRTAVELEEQVLRLRRQLRKDSDLGAYGADAIQQALRAQGLSDPPSVRTIHRILQRRGALDSRSRVRRPPPPRGWYLPDLAQGRAELDSFDIVEGLVIQGGPQVEILNGVSLHGGLPASWPVVAPVTAKKTVTSLVEHWREVGLPQYAQFDNDMIFQGTHRYPDALGRVIRACLSLGVTPVFVPPREMGFQAAIESYNGWWQARVWLRFQHASVADLCDRSGRYVTALRRHRLARIEAAPERRRFPAGWQLDLQATPQGRLIYLRRADGQGGVEVLGQRWQVSENGPHRLVRVEVDLTGKRLRFYTLRRRESKSQPLALEVPYQLPPRRFQE